MPAALDAPATDGPRVWPAPEPVRDRIMRAVVEVVVERGIADASVKLVIARAGVSSRTFYEQFEGLDACMIEIMDRVLAETCELAVHGFAEQESWLDGMRSALAAVLTFMDSHPQLARFCLVETTQGNRIVLEQRLRVVRQFRATVVAQIEHQVAAHPSPLAAEGLLASVMSIAYEHLVDGAPGPLVEMLGPLMGLIASQVEDREIAAEQVLRGEQLAQALMVAMQPSATAPPDAAPRDTAAEAALPAVFGNPQARRGRECLLFVAEQCRRGHHPCNREVAEGIGVAHKSQISRLLHCLVEAGLLTKRSDGPGERNSWSLTALGETVACSLERDQQQDLAFPIVQFLPG